jgi:hypothetical protein
MPCASRWDRIDGMQKHLHRRDLRDRVDVEVSGSTSPCAVAEDVGRHRCDGSARSIDHDESEVGRSENPDEAAQINVPSAFYP